MANCSICGDAVEELQQGSHLDIARVDCRRCGTYEISDDLHWTLLDAHVEKRYLLSGLLREHSERGTPLLLTRHNLAELLSAARPPRNPFEAIDRLLLYLLDNLPSPSASVEMFAERDYPLVYACDQHEFALYLQQAERLGYIRRDGLGVKVSLDLEGWKRLDELRRTRVISDQAFVAMWFAPEVREAWMNGIEPALHATGYRPLRLDFLEYNEKVDDRIVAEIRRSALIVADFSGDRSNVYFEAGLALGLGIPVIWTCRESDVPNLHFDTRQYNYIAWSDPADLREKLELRIRATIPNHPNAGAHP